MSRSPGWVAAVVLAGAAGLLVLADIGLVLSNQSAAAVLAGRRDVIAQTPQLSRVVQVVASGLAQAAVRNDDPALHTLLSANGITVGVNPPSIPTQPAPTATSPAPAAIP